MLKIGMDKTDRTFRHFEYDDERKYGNPLVYKVLYEETGEFGEVKCSDVISIKKSTNSFNHFLDIPIYTSVKKDDMSEPNQTAINENEISKSPTEKSEVCVEKKKTKSSKAKSKTPTKSDFLTVKDTAIGITQSLPKSYEYDVLVVDNISYIEDVKSKLNELGKDGWEVCGFQIVQKLFGGCSQAIIIMKKGLN